jgi:tetratricopeptide (TPR) repeat protein
MKCICFAILILTGSSFSLSAEPAVPNPPDFETAKSLLNHGKASDALTMLEFLAKDDPQNAEKEYYLAKAYSWAGRYEESLAAYTRAAELDSAKGEIYYQSKFGIAQVTGWQKKYSQSVFLYAALLDEAGKKKARREFIRDIYLGMGDTSSWNNDYDFALSSYQHALETDPSSAEPLDRISKIYFWKNDYKTAKDYAQKALTIKPDHEDSLNRIKDIDLIKQYILSLASTTTTHSAKNTKGDGIRTEEVVLNLTYQPDNDTTLRFFSDAYVQNSIETTNASKAGNVNYDVQLGIGASRKFYKTVYLGTEIKYTYNAVLLPDFSAELDAGYKVSRIFDLVGMYRITYDRIDSYESDKRPVSHIIAPGGVLYFTPRIYIRAQCYIDTNMRNYMLSGFSDLTFEPSPFDKLDIYGSYGKGQNVMVYGSSWTNVSVMTMGIAGSYTHYFNAGFGLGGSLSWTKNKWDTAVGFGVQTEFRL